MSDGAPGEERWRPLLATGEIEVLGRMPWSSNSTYLVSLCLGDLEGRAVYKPGRGERPLRDFPAELYRREAAAYELSAFTGLDVVPLTIVREDGPFGEGSLQRFVDADFAEHYFTFMEQGGYEGPLHAVAGFDLIANNADRKGGHLLVDHEGHLWGIDNGLCFHVYDKLRTVMWDFAGEELPEPVLRAYELVLSGLPASFTDLVDDREVEALLGRCEYYLDYRRYPHPPESHRAYPWPLV